MTLRDELPVGIAVFDRQTGQFVQQENAAGP
jgi:hypothetical protein